VTKILILGAHGQIARVATRLLLDRTDAELTLYLRKAKRLFDTAALAAAMAGQDIVHANLSGDMEKQARTIVTAMDKAGVSRLIFISSMGIYDEVPGERRGTFSRSLSAFGGGDRGSDLGYTIITAWLNDDDEIAYGTTVKGEPFANAGAYVSRKSVGALIVKLVTNPTFGVRESIGVHAV
jgi:uncharacterized protein YbjT (DUF2867 family)